MRGVWVIAAVLVAACDTGSLEFLGIEAQTVTVGQSTFDVRRKDNEVELVRTNIEFASSLRAVMPRAAMAVSQVTGCTPVDGTWSGDAAMMRVAISCDD